MNTKTRSRDYQDNLLWAYLNRVIPEGPFSPWAARAILDYVVRYYYPIRYTKANGEVTHAKKAKSKSISTT